MSPENPMSPEISDAHGRAAELIPWLVNGTLAEKETAELRAHLAVCSLCRGDLEAEQRLFEAVRGEGPLVFAGEPSLQKLLARIEADDFALPARAAGGEAAEDAGPACALEAAAAAAAPARPATPSAFIPDTRPGRGGPLRGARQRSPRRRLPAHRAVRWLTMAVAAEALVLAFGAWLWQSGALDRASYSAGAAPLRSEVGPYRTLTSPERQYGSGPRVRVVFSTDLSLEQLQRLLQSVNAHIVDGPTEARVYTLGFAGPLGGRSLEMRIDTLRADPHVLFAEPAIDRPR